MQFAKFLSAAVLVCLVLVGCSDSSVDLDSFFDEPMQHEKVTGIWEGKLGDIRIVVKLSTEGSTLKGSLDSPDQGAMDMNIQQVRFDGQNIAVEVASINAIFIARLSDSVDQLDGQWIQNGTTDLVLERVDKPSIRKRLQNPEPPFPYRVSEVTFPGGTQSVSLSGSLTRPDTSEFPVMILVSGSGPQDRDETLMGHKPFWVLADYLARRGIATLRYDDRGVGRSTGDFANATTADFADDANAAIKYLKSSGLIAPSRIGLIGHSEGGLVVAMLGAKREEGLLTCGVMLAGPSVSGTEIHQSQIRDMMEASTFPLPDSTISKVLGLSSEIYPANYLPGTWEERKRLGFELYEKAYERFNILEKVLLGIDGQSNQLAEAIVNPWFSFFLKYDPRTDLSLQQKPILALYASLDKQVSSKQNIASLQTINNDYIEVQIFSGLNHMFQHAETGLPDEYAIIEETMAPKVLETISAWTLGNC